MRSAWIEALLDVIVDKIAERLERRGGPRPGRRPLLTVSEAAAELSTNPGALRQMIRRGKIAAIKDGKHTRVESSEIEAYIDRNRTL